MKLERAVTIGSVLGWIVIVGCGGSTSTSSTTPAPSEGQTPAVEPELPVAKDSEVRTYIRDELAPYLALIVEELCLIKYEAAANVGDDVLCPGDPEGYKPPPPNGKP
jgi:hypothetical protein